MSEINKTATDPTLTEQEQSWELMSVLGMKWSETKELSEEDKKFLLEKVENIKLQMRAQALSINT
ncbi:MAG: hypothetical protein GTO02_14880 [Candidatus Dadabacteria bacterium]|nr:hypothetical protein [Candidatus Dadabacteria bacterium]NIQ15626.1 hypothetical protein [Candidatus Dadabacteria bacterium]